MPKIRTSDGVNLYYEEVGAGTPIVFVHEFAGDYRTWEPQMRRFARTHRCVTFSQRGYPPSDIPDDPARYGQDIARADVVALMDALGIERAHVVGHSMGAYTALHVGIKDPQRCISVTAAGCGWGSLADPAARAAMRAQAAETSKMFIEKGMDAAAVLYTDNPTRNTQKYKDPRGYAEFVRMLAEHSAKGHSLTMAMLQVKRPTLWDMEADLKKFSVHFSSSSATRMKPASTAACSSSAQRRRQDSSSSRAPAIPSPAKSRMSSMPRSPSSSPLLKAADGSHTSRPDARRRR